MPTTARGFSITITIPKTTFHFHQMDSKTLSIVRSLTVGKYPYKAAKKPEDYNFFEKLLYNAHSEDVIEFDSLEWLPFLDLDIGSQLNKLFDDVELSVDDTRQRWQLAFDVWLILLKRFPNCRVYVFGSFLTGLCDVHCSVDIFVEIESDYGIKDGMTLQALRHYLLNAYCRHRRSRFVKQELEVNELPDQIFRFQHRISGIGCAIFLDKLIYVQNSKLFQFYVNFDPRVNQFLSLLRYWVAYHGLCEKVPGKMTMYAVSMLALVYLVKRKIVPSLKLLQLLASIERMKTGVKNNYEEIDGYDCSFCTDMELIETCFDTDSLPSNYSDTDVRANIILGMLREFFEMLWEVNYPETVFCTRTGKLLLRKDAWKQLDSDNLLVILDPLENDVNVTANVADESFHAFLETARATQMVLARGTKSILELFGYPSTI